MFFLMPWAVFANYSSPQTFNSIVEPRPQIPPVTGHAASLFPVTTVLSTAEAIWCGRAERVRITNPGDASVTITIDRHLTGLVAGKDASLTFNGVTGALVHPATSEPSMAATATAAVFNLHEAHFARSELRWLLFVCGAIGTAMVASGLVLWTEKRRRKLLDPDYHRLGFRFVDVFNAAVTAGYPLATAALFWANRLLPISTTSRANAEILCAFVCWGLSLVWSVVRPSRKAWVEVLGAAAALFLLLPLVNAATAPRGTLTKLTHGDALYVGFDLVSLALGVAFAVVALSVRRRASLQTPPSLKGGQVKLNAHIRSAVSRLTPNRQCTYGDSLLTSDMVAGQGSFRTSSERTSWKLSSLQALTRRTTRQPPEASSRWLSSLQSRFAEAPTTRRTYRLCE